MSEVYSSVWTRCPESEIWDALKENRCEQVQESEVPGPVLRILKSLQVKGEPLLNNRFFRVDSRLLDGYYMYMLLPNDTTKDLTVTSNSDWLFRRRLLWEDVKLMTPAEVKIRVAEIVSEYLGDKHPEKYGRDRRCYAGLARKGIDIAIEVFNWTALEYEAALAHTARQLWNMLFRGEVRRLENDHWTLSIKHDLFLFVTRDTDGMNYYGHAVAKVGHHGI